MTKESTIFIVKGKRRTKKRKTLYIGGDLITHDLLKILDILEKRRLMKYPMCGDSLIEAFTTHMLDGTSVTLGDYEFDLPKNELGVRYMALEASFCASQPW